MTVARYPALRGADLAQLGWHLRPLPVERLENRDDGCYITHEADPAALDAAVAAYVEERDWRPPLPDAIRTHVGHLRDFRNAVRAGTFGNGMTAAQRRDATEHVIADLIDGLRLMLDDRLG